MAPEESNTLAAECMPDNGDYGWDTYHSSARIGEQSSQFQNLMAGILGDDLGGPD